LQYYRIRGLLISHLEAVHCVRCTEVLKIASLSRCVSRICRRLRGTWMYVYWRRHYATNGLLVFCGLWSHGEIQGIKE